LLRKGESRLRFFVFILVPPKTKKYYLKIGHDYSNLPVLFKVTLLFIIQDSFQRISESCFYEVGSNENSKSENKYFVFTRVLFYHNTRHNIPDDSHLQRSFFYVFLTTFILSFSYFFDSPFHFRYFHTNPPSYFLTSIIIVLPIKIFSLNDRNSVHYQ
jgi:hypothetical protein